MSTDSNRRLMSLLVCWVIHAGLLMFIGFTGLLMGLMGPPEQLLSFYEPIFGAAVLPFARLIELIVSSAVWVLLAGGIIGLAALGGFLRKAWGRTLLRVVTWMHIIGLLPLLLTIHLNVGLSGIVGTIVVIAELGTGIASVVVLRGSLKIIDQVTWGAERVG
ncbi:MAG: hypothetical protein P8R54_03780 [Myxococcota bacterium]|nr:hypothetical protein [Myxococcota bacterium]